MTETGYIVIMGQLFKCVAKDGKMELIEEKIGGQFSCKTCGLKVSKILLEGRKWWKCGECNTRNYTMPRNPGSLKKQQKDVEQEDEWEQDELDEAVREKKKEGR